MKSRTCDVRLFIRRQEEQFHIVEPVLDLTPGFQAVQERHRDVQDDDVGLELLGRGEQGPAVRDLPNNFAFAREELLEGGQQQRVIVREEDPGRTHPTPTLLSLFLY